MGAIGVLGLSRHRRGAGLPVLGGAILVVLVYNPWLARSYGFALSTLATLGLLVLAGPWGESLGIVLDRWVAGSTRVARLRRWCGGSITPRLPMSIRQRSPTWSGVGSALAIPVAAQVVCAPVIVLLQSSITVVGVLANLLAAPLVPITTIGGVLVAALALVWPRGAQWLAWLPGLPALGIARVGRVCADLPLGSIPWPGGAPGALALTALTVVALLLGRSLSRLAGRRPLASLAVIALVVALAAPTRVITWPPTGWHLVSCDVGQGDATVLRTGPHRAVVVDVGPDPALIDGCLDRLGIQSIDAVILTHFHLDHVGGLDGVTRGRSVGTLLTTWIAEPEEMVRAVSAWSAREHVPTQTLHAGDTLHFGSLTAQVWWPARRIDAGSVPNNASVVLATDDDGVRALLLGDLEREAGAALLSRIRRDQALSADAASFDVVKSPHHGSANIDPALMAAVRAPLAIISVGADNDYGHPAPSHLTLLHNLGYAVRRTDLAGDIAVTRDADVTRVVTER
jgi:competence protein ComEC